MESGGQMTPSEGSAAATVGSNLGSECALAGVETQRPAADLLLHGAAHGWIELSGGVEMQRAARPVEQAARARCA